MKVLLYIVICLLTTKTSGNQFTRLVVSILDLYAYEVLNSAENETECIKQLKLYHSDLKQRKMWAGEMMDSSGKIQSGILTGNLYFVGNYDECLDVNTISNGSHIEGQYCRAYVVTNKKTDECVNKNFIQKYSIKESVIQELKPLIRKNWDSCFPSVCSALELQSLWNYAEKRYDVQFHIIFSDDGCTSYKKQNIYPQFDVIIIGVFAAIAGICLLSTAYDVIFFQYQKTKRLQWFIAFSYYTNGKRLLTIKKEDDDDSQLTCLRGIKVLSMVWIIFGHRFLSNYVGTSINTQYALEWFEHEQNMFIMGSFACVDTFFVVSGCLLMYLILMANENGIKINLFTFYFHRLIRLSPALIAMVLTYKGIFAHLGSGPYWGMTNYLMVKPCEEWWWATMLYVQNYVKPFQPCLIQSWYLAVDTQLYILSPFIFLPMLRWPKITICAILGLIAASIGLIVRATYAYNINGANFRTQVDFYKHIYNPTELRMGPWLVGLILGYIMFKTNGYKVNLNKALVIFLWVLSVGLLLFISYLYVYFIKYKYTLPLIASFFSLSRTGWGICVSWVIFACGRGHGGFINKFLSLSIFNILGRLTYSMYLTHLLVMYVVEGQRATPAYADNLIHMHGVWGDFAFTIALSIVWTLTFESPITILEKSLLSSGKKNVLHIQEK